LKDLQVEFLPSSVSFNPSLEILQQILKYFYAEPQSHLGSSQSELTIALRDAICGKVVATLLYLFAVFVKLATTLSDNPSDSHKSVKLVAKTPSPTTNLHIPPQHLQSSFLPLPMPSSTQKPPANQHGKTDHHNQPSIRRVCSYYRKSQTPTGKHALLLVPSSCEAMVWYAIIRNVCRVSTILPLHRSETIMGSNRRREWWIIAHMVGSSPFSN